MVADAAGEISNGFMLAYSYKSTEEFKRVVCYQHVNVAKHTHLNKTDKVQIKVLFKLVLRIYLNKVLAIFTTE